MNRPRAADDFAAIRARMEELRCEREGTKPSEEVQRDAPLPRSGVTRRPPSESSAGPSRVRQSGAVRRAPVLHRPASAIGPDVLWTRYLQAAPR